LACSIPLDSRNIPRATNSAVVIAEKIGNRMPNEKGHNWIQSIAAISVLIGLFLVIWEPRQARELTRLELTAYRANNEYQQQLTVMGDRFAEIEVTACLSPEPELGTEVVLCNQNRVYSILFF
jgi:hypothetical protein